MQLEDGGTSKVNKTSSNILSSPQVCFMGRLLTYEITTNISFIVLYTLVDVRFSTYIYYLKMQNCRLALGSKNKIVAKGKVYGKTGPLEKIHNISLGEHNVRVSIDCVLCPDSPLPIPVHGILTTILDAHNSFVAWPEKWVILGDKVKCIFQLLLVMLKVNYRN